MADARIRELEGGFMLEWHDYPFEIGTREFLCRSIEEACTRVRHLFEAIIGRTHVSCNRCNGSGSDPSAPGYEDVPCTKCNGHRVLNSRGEPVEK